MHPEKRHIHHCVVVGTGPAGLAAALALARFDVDVALIGPQPRATEADARTAALFNSSIALLQAIGAWDALEDAGAPLQAIRIVDDTGGLLRAPEIVFKAQDVGFNQFGWNIPNALLVTALWDACVRSPHITIASQARVGSLTSDAHIARLTLTDSEQVHAHLVVAADGRNSVCRKAASIGSQAWEYDQNAITTVFSHSRPHLGISTELHRRAGPLTTVPMPGLASSLVWVETVAEAKRLAALDDATFRRTLESRLWGLLGSIGEMSPRHCIPLSGLAADRMAQSRVALVGEAGHVMPPIGAQGLNLGLRDGAWIAEIAASAVHAGEDPGADRVLDSYHGARSGDVAGRIATVDTLNWSLIAGLLPVDLARGLALHALAAVPAVKRAVIRQGLSQPHWLPLLMREAEHAVHAVPGIGPRLQQRGP
jgi:2-octaprenyl-6-methoxyphenol hydroxylase